MKYHHHKDGEWVTMRDYPNHKIACCDCGLVHLLEFREVAGKVQFRAFRDNRATAQRRRNKEFKPEVTPGV